MRKIIAKIIIPSGETDGDGRHLWNKPVFKTLYPNISPSIDFRINTDVIIDYLDDKLYSYYMANDKINTNYNIPHTFDDNQMYEVNKLYIMIFLTVKDSLIDDNFKISDKLFARAGGSLMMIGEIIDILKI